MLKSIYLLNVLESDDYVSDKIITLFLIGTLKHLDKLASADNIYTCGYKRIILGAVGLLIK